MRAKYVMSEVFLGLWRNISMTVAMIITMAVSLSMLGAGLLLYNQVDVIEEYYQTNLEVVVYLERDIDQAMTDQINAELKDNDLVAEVVYESKEKALERFQETFEDSPDLVKSVDADVLPSAFRVKMKDIADAPELIKQFEEREGVYQVTNQREILQQVFDILGGAQRLTLVIALVQGVAALMLVANTIQVAAYSRRREVAIMKLVGAPNWFVQAPFVLEAVFAAVIGSVFAFGTLVAAKFLVIDGQFEDLFKLMPQIKMQAILVLLPILVGVSAVISAITAWITLRFNIKV
ncbi:permease-like cell division protein FtsX [Glycomyces algeriensis]|jgi:cell division transport system permease protein|uniref:Cell division protein FtsX n=1 Tax=Glycomyces algeriensis TaxID=256037 RepID=A0A9W6G7K4_9ACTN|nr:permease-like cell division protein FtsX [Glycomyces algeriensis]MDA1365972.1 permease-like cell division protein FtsX [Glycomyces algeriensis]MDR7349261.1 cell division transport system permease protein [Glycomyces algeriensis]GLI41961.1 cell division protein FtsX [Glycomyces algeriensis]